jgi:RNA polymerase sigma-70 factor (ECF subfamily)
LSKEITIGLSEFEALFKVHYSELCGYANKYLDDLAAAEETVQSLFVKLWETRETVKIEKSPRAYLFTATRNACFNQLRHIKVREEYKEYNQSEMEKERYTVADEYQATELDGKIRASIERLPEGRRKIFILSRFEGLKYKEIAVHLKISVKTVENQMGSAIKHLRKDLADYLTVLIIILFN